MDKQEIIQLAESKMNKYKLIKVTEGYIIVSNEKTIGGDFYINLHYNNIGQYDKEQSPPQSVFVKKIIASNFIPELPNIDFNGMEEEFGVIDVKQLANNTMINYLTDNNPEGDFKHSTIGADENKNWWVRGFNKSLELNKDKKYTLEDIKTAIRYGCNQIHLEKNKINNFIQSLQPKTEFEIELETEWIKDFPKGGFGGAGSIDIEQPKITNNSIKIIRNA